MNRIQEISYIPNEIGHMVEAGLTGSWGIAAATLALVTLGYFETINTQAAQVARLNELLLRPYLRTLRILNPEALPVEKEPALLPSISLTRLIGKMAPSVDRSDPLFGRIEVWTFQIICTITATIDLLAGVVLATLSLSLFGYFDTLNSWAFANLSQSPPFEWVCGVLHALFLDLPINEETLTTITTFEDRTR